jgi:hypothetical protein
MCRSFSQLTGTRENRWCQAVAATDAYADSAPSSRGLPQAGRPASTVLMRIAARHNEEIGALKSARTRSLSERVRELDKVQGNQSQVARLLDVLRRKLASRPQAYGLLRSSRAE